MTSASARHDRHCDNPVPDADCICQDPHWDPIVGVLSDEDRRDIARQFLETESILSPLSDAERARIDAFLAHIQ